MAKPIKRPLDARGRSRLACAHEARKGRERGERPVVEVRERRAPIPFDVLRGFKVAHNPEDGWVLREEREEAREEPRVVGDRAHLRKAHAAQRLGPDLRGGPSKGRAGRRARCRRGGRCGARTLNHFPSLSSFSSTRSAVFWSRVSPTTA